jgi:hypothetical protein
VTNLTLAGETPCADSSALISSGPMLLTPFTPIVCPASWLTVLIRELPGTTSARVSGDKMEASARIRNRAPAAWAAR